MDEIGKLCKELDIGHVINNAYGVQCSYIRKLVNRACVVGRVDYVIQSTDKNFMVPVGGAIVASPIAGHIKRLGQNYAGRASIGPIMDLFITFLHMGEVRLRQLLFERERLFDLMITQLTQLQHTYPMIRVLNTPDNRISIGIALVFETPPSNDVSGQANKGLTMDVNSIGSILFHKCISGARLIYSTNKVTTMNGISFSNWGSHYDAYPYMPYLTVAVGIGMTENEVHRFISEFGKVLKKFQLKITIRK